MPVLPLEGLPFVDRFAIESSEAPTAPPACSPWAERASRGRAASRRAGARAYGERMAWMRLRTAATPALDALVAVVPVAPLLASFALPEQATGGGALRLQVAIVSLVLLLGLLAVRQLVRVGWARRGGARVLGAGQAWAVVALGVSTAWYTFGVVGIHALEAGIVGRALYQGLVGIVASAAVVGWFAVRRPRPAAGPGGEASDGPDGSHDRLEP
jgi:hypothetical protein